MNGFERDFYAKKRKKKEKRKKVDENIRELFTISIFVFRSKEQSPS